MAIYSNIQSVFFKTKQKSQTHIWMETNEFFTPQQSNELPSHENTSDHSQNYKFIKVKPKIDPHLLTRLMSLEGQCKIHSYQFLRFNLVKSILLMIPIVLTVIGLFILKYYPCFRTLVFYDKAEVQEATHIFVKNNSKGENIVKIEVDEESREISFTYKKLKYILLDGRSVPVGFKYEEEFQKIFKKDQSKYGLTSEEVIKRQKIFGKNQHKVKIPSFFTYLLDVLTTPFFLLQYLFCFVYFIQGYAAFSGALIFFSVVTTTINYIMLYVSYSRIKAMAERQVKVNVIRNRKVQEINCVDLVPGDVFQPRNQIPCDALVLSGDVYVNQANLTGESYPIGKFPVTDLESTENGNTWLNEGSKVLQVRENSLAVVINIGFQTCRGRIIRKILTRERRQPDLFRSAIFFIVEAVIIGTVGFFASLPLLLSLDIEPAFIFFKLFDFLGSAAPPPLPIFFNVAYSFSLTRLRMKEISGTEPQQTVNGAYVKTLCFDKTGTLTEIQVEMKKIYKIEENDLIDISHELEEEKNKLVKKLFGCCHTVKQIGEQFMGDEIDKEMFFKSMYKMKLSSEKHVKHTIENENEKLQILRINQFQSKFQSMSVLVRDTDDNKYYIFVKGAPEKIFKNSINKVSKYNSTVTSLSLSGFRTIGFGYKMVNPKQLDKILLDKRQNYEFNINVLGLVGFQNKLKEDAEETMQRLFQSNIQPKMITGDNIFIAAETASRCGIIRSNEPLILLEGHKQAEGNEEKRVFKGILLRRNEEDEASQEQVQLYQDESYLNQELPIAIDGDFLNLHPPPALPNTIAIFSRIRPEDKAKIVVKLKMKIKEKLFATQSKFAHLLKINRLKVGMCGDGANDLLALREADLSLGIQESDASYGSSFTIQKLLDSDEIIRQSKNTQANIIQLFQYYTATGFFNLLSSIIMISDSTYYSSATLMFLNFTSVLIFPVMFCFSRPASTPTRYVPDSNFMSLHNHLIYWGNVIIPTCAIIGGYFYFFNTSEFAANPKPSITIANGFHSQNHSATIIFLMVLVPFAFNAFFVYSADPWKQKFYKNIPFTILFLVNVALSITFFFITKEMTSAFEMVEISYKNAGICLGITMGGVLLSFVYNSFIRSLKLDHKVLIWNFDEKEAVEKEK